MTKDMLFLFLGLLVAFGCDNMKLVDNPCSSICPAGSFCADGTCKCFDPKFRVVNNKWCTPAGSFVAYVDPWYNCLDTFSFDLMIPPNLEPPDVLPNATVVFYNRKHGIHNSSYGSSIMMGIYYYPLLNGDSMEVYGVPPSMQEGTCRLPNASCEVFMFGKFLSSDTIDLTLMLYCRPPTVAQHKQKIKVLAVRIK